MTKQNDRTILWHCFRLFFEDLNRWRLVSRHMGIDSSISQIEYDYLLKGTQADVFVPLWASCAKTGTRELCNEVTLDVIRFYKECGYEPVLMDGNPADYIGEQFRFLEYLSTCESSGDRHLAGKAEDFIGAFVVDTVRAVREALLFYSDHPELRALCSHMSRAVKGKDIHLFDTDEFPTASTVKSADAWTAGEPIPLEPERCVAIASFNDCGAKCLMNARVQEGCVLEITPNTDVLPFTGCARGRAYRQTFLTADRLRYPMERIGKRGEGRFRRISWEEAAEKIAREIERTGIEAGPSSRFVTPASGVSALLRGDRFMKRLLGLSGGYLEYYNYYSAACANYVTPYVYGTLECGHTESDILHAGMIILWGHNPSANHFGPFFNRTLTQAKEQGIPIVVIDPRKSETVLTYADWWIAIKPSTDSALADAMCWHILQNKLQDQAFMDAFCVGFDEAHMPEGVPDGESYAAYLSGEKDGIEKTAEWAQSITGIPAENIRRLAEQYAKTKPACILPGLGPQRTGNGEQFYRSMAALACITGNVGKSGGSSGGTPWIPTRTHPEFTAVHNPFPGAIPSFLWTDAVEDATRLTPEEHGVTGVEKLDSSIELVFNLANSLLLTQHSDVNRTAALLADESKIRMIVVSDVFLTSGAKFADLVLPAPSFFEVDNIVPPWVTDNYLLYNQRCMEPLFGCRFEYEWIRDVSTRLGLEDLFTDGKPSLEDWMVHLYDQARDAEPELPPLAGLKEAGGFVYEAGEPYIAFQKLIEENGCFNTPSGKIEIFSKTLYDMGRPDEIPGLPRYVPSPEGPHDPLKEKYPLQLIGYHTKRRCHSIHENNPLMEELEPPAFWIHPADACERGIKNGELMEVFNDRGCVRIPALVTDRIMKGVVALSEGGWFRPAADGADERGCINVLTSSRPTPLARGNPQHTNLVQARKV